MHISKPDKAEMVSILSGDNPAHQDPRKYSRTVVQHILVNRFGNLTPFPVPTVAFIILFLLHSIPYVHIINDLEIGEHYQGYIGGFQMGR